MFHLENASVISLGVRKESFQILTSGGSINLSTDSDMMKKAINKRNKLLTKPAMTSARTYPYEYLSFAFHFVMTDAARPANSPVQSKNIWNESDMRPGNDVQVLKSLCFRKTLLQVLPKLFVHIP